MGTRANRSAGVSNNKATPPVLKYTELNNLNNASGKKSFKITTKETTPVTWNFALLPSVEAALQYGPNTSVKGAITVPEVKPGILNNTTAKYKNSLVPGGAPVIQGVGIQATTRQLVGLFIGTEGTGNSFPSLNPIYRVNEKTYKETSTGVTQNDNAIAKARKFDTDIVQKMKVVTITINSDVNFEFECVIVNFKYYLRSANRVYYVMDVLSTKYLGD
jgi:hypothetical protein